jgi:two-component system KDP operon response regulator KdpE
MKKGCILIVDDEVSILRYVSARLRKEGYEVVTASNGKEALQRAEEENPLLVMLDIMMPEIDGFEVCRRLREWTQVPIIMLSARGDESDKVKCFEFGADDYITKPFGSDELLARVKAVLHRTDANIAPVCPAFACGELKVGFAERQVTVAGRKVKLTPTEFSLLQELTLNAGKVLTHAHLLQKIWGPEYRNEKEYLHEFARRLRKKLEPDRENPRYIISVSGVGYQFGNGKNLN